MRRKHLFSAEYPHEVKTFAIGAGRGVMPEVFAVEVAVTIDNGRVTYEKRTLHRSGGHKKTPKKAWEDDDKGSIGAATEDLNGSARAFFE